MGPPPWIWRVLMPLLIVAAGLVAYANSFAGVFMFDDRLWIIGDRRLKVLWPLGELLRRRRPVVDYSLALNHAVGGDAAWGFHAVNLAIHILAALTLFGVVRRTLMLEPLRKRFGRSAGWLATVVGLLWVVHPLQTQSVNYIIQRSESMMGLFYLLTLYCVIRGASSSREVGWYALAIVSAALGMGSKAVMITAPVAVLLYDRAFLSATWGDALRRRWGLYVGLVATWSLLGLTGEAQGVLNPNRTDAHVGFGYRGVSPLGYALTQCGVLLHYVKLSLIPRSLCLDYDWPMARTVAEIIPQAIALLALLGATVWALVKHPRLGFVAAWFFVVLAPTSSIIPIKDAAFEHRMYLPLASIIVLVVLAVDHVLRRTARRLEGGDVVRRIVATALTVLVAAALAYGTVRRNQTYHSESAMWRDVLTKQPRSARAAENLATALLAEKKLDEALTMLQEALKVNPHSANVLNGLGFVLVAHRRLDEAIDSFREAIRWNPAYARAYINLGNAMNDKGRPDEALQQFAMAVQISPSNTDARLNLGNSYLAKGDADRAIEQYARIVQFDPAHAKAWGNLGYALLSKASADLTPRGTQVDLTLLDRAVEALRRALAIDPQSYNAWNNLGIVLMTQASLARAAGKADEAKAKLGEGVEAFRGALRVRPDLAAAHYNIANALVENGDDQGALAQYVETLKIDSRHVNARYEMGMLLWKTGDRDRAEQMLQTVLELAPDHPEAKKALDDIRRQKEATPAP